MSRISVGFSPPSMLLSMQQRSRDISYVQFDSKRRKLGREHLDDLSSKDMDMDTCSKLTDDGSSKPIMHTNENMIQMLSSAESRVDFTPANGCSKEVFGDNIENSGLPG